ncbi:DUF1850 domain-containing protein [Planococcus sp. ISL-109]|uniref:DUF1850 domain-containing protein n=1 Tax=Planococcus sp. ISL-109 TaxID=2819166 RepID=UPI001BE72EFB|nr:DUF1850 domain-containing protein [Planococcus sp. ISL-109]MBT2583900.1 DUF1850 domain-containing protein [Planococcus sp. ISL-109]
MVLLFFLLIKLPVIAFETDGEQFYLKEKAFELSWIHSVEKEEWREFYERDGGTLTLTETHFKTFGAGVPSDGIILPSDDGFVHMRIDRVMDELNLTVSENAQTTIRTGGREIKLYALIDDYETFRISVDYIHLWNYVGGKTL